MIARGSTAGSSARTEFVTVQSVAAIINERLTPSRLAVDVKRGITRPDLVSITSKDSAFKVVTAMTDRDPFFRRQQSVKHRPQRVKVSTIPGHGVACLHRCQYDSLCRSH